jgi:hypothetical protein
VLATPVTGGGLLGATADLVEGRVGEADHMEVIDHEPGLGQARGHGCGVGLVGVDHHMADPRQPRRRAGSTEADQVIDPGPAVITHCGHRRVPRHAEVPGRLGHGVLGRLDTTGALAPGRSVSTAWGRDVV